jgi:glycosyltransferase involved in cell wall biosynthesis/SAM-dependent methyltransferase
VKATNTINVLHLRSCRGKGGGPEKTILFSAKEANPRLFCLHIAYLKSQDDAEFALDERAKQLGIENFITVEERFKFDIRALRKLLRVLREKEIDILHCHCYKSDLYGIILSRYHKMKLVTTAHGPLASLRHFWSGQNWRVRYVYDQIDLRLLRYFDHVLVVADSMRNTIAGYGVDRRKLTYVKNAIDARFFRREPSRSAELRERLRLPAYAKVIGAVGRLNAEKDYPNFFEAAQRLLRQRDDLFFTIAGQGPLEDTLRRQVQDMKLTERVLFLGHFHDIRPVYDLMDVYVLSSSREGLPNTVLEAMAMEVPIVATDVDGVSEAVTQDHEALLVPARSPQLLAERIGAVLVDPALVDRLREAARTRVVNEFSFAARMRRVEGIYRAVMGVDTCGVPVRERLACLNRDCVTRNSSGPNRAATAQVATLRGFRPPSATLTKGIQMLTTNHSNTMTATQPNRMAMNAQRAPDNPSGRLKAILFKGGLYYSTLYVMRWVVDRVLAFVDRRLVAVEQRRRLVEPWTIGARRYTAADNKQLWNNHDWSRHGEEWTKTPEWKAKVIEQFLLPNVPEGKAVLEIGPGGGRWTEVLQRRAKHVHVVDVSEQAIALCRQRFQNCLNVEYHVGNGNTLPLANTSVEVIWSYDVFVHINPLDARNYFREFARILKPGGKAVIHHPGSSKSRKYREGAWRSDLTDTMVLDFARENGLEVVFRTQELVNEGDVLSVLLKPE